MKLLVTGGLGYIGSHFSTLALEDNHQVFIIDNLSNSVIHVKEEIEQISEKKCRFEQIDLRDKDELSCLFRNESFDAVVHFAGLKSVAESVDSPLLYYQNNVVGSLNLLEMIHESNIRSLIFSSSATVYGPPDHLPYTEEHLLRPVNPYGQTKLCCENMFKDYTQSQMNFGCVALRYFNPIGAHPSGLLKERSQTAPTNLIPYIIQVAKRERAVLNVFGNDYQTIDGTGIRDYIHVLDLVKGHLKALAFLQNNEGFHAFNLGSGKGYSVFEVVKIFERVNNVRIPFNIEPRRKGDLAEYWADPHLASKLLDWECEASIEEMLKDSWRCYST